MDSITDGRHSDNKCFPSQLTMMTVAVRCLVCVFVPLCLLNHEDTKTQSCENSIATTTARSSGSNRRTYGTTRSLVVIGRGSYPWGRLRARPANVSFGSGPVP